jgi:hypothetical protein
VGLSLFLDNPADERANAVGNGHMELVTIVQNDPRRG